MVEDLLKRLPGVELDSDGKIIANGKQVTKILVDGKEFFSDHPSVASKNLPVEMMDKVQIIDRKSDLAQLTGVDDGEEETVVNLTVKKGMKKGWSWFGGRGPWHRQPLPRLAERESLFRRQSGHGARRSKQCERP